MTRSESIRAAIRQIRKNHRKGVHTEYALLESLEEVACHLERQEACVTLLKAGCDEIKMKRHGHLNGMSTDDATNLFDRSDDCVKDHPQHVKKIDTERGYHKFTCTHCNYEFEYDSGD